MNFSLSFALTCTIQCNLECDPSILSATKSAYRHFSHWTTGKNAGWKRSLENFCLQILPEAGLASLWGKSLGYIALMGQSLRCFRWTPRKRPPVVKRNPGGEKILYSVPRSARRQAGGEGDWGWGWVSAHMSCITHSRWSVAALKLKHSGDGQTW